MMQEENMKEDLDSSPLELNLGGRHLLAALVGLVALSASFFFLGRWVERSSWESDYRPASFEAAAEMEWPAEVDDGYDPVDIDEDLTFYEELEKGTEISKVSPTVTEESAGGFTIQVFATQDSGAADQRARKLKEKGYPAYVESGTDGKNRSLFRVRVGPFSGRGLAEEMAVRLQKEEGLSTWVLAQ